MLRTLSETFSDVVRHRPVRLAAALFLSYRTGKAAGDQCRELAAWVLEPKGEQPEPLTVPEDQDRYELGFELGYSQGKARGYAEGWNEGRSEIQQAADHDRADQEEMDNR